MAAGGTLEKKPVGSRRGSTSVKSPKARATTSVKRPGRAADTIEARPPAGADHGRGVAMIGLTCSRCGTHTDVNMLRYATLHMPVWLWRPGRGYTSFMKCPACSRRTWVSATWAPWRR
jgi:hypothetical protein